MTLVSPSQSAAGETIEHTDINDPVNQIAAVINGNLDDSNIASVSGSKLVDDTVTNAKLALSTTTDANGWTVFDYGNFKEYTIKTPASSATKVQYEAFDVASGDLPVGVLSTDIKNIQVTPIYIDYTEFLGNINIRHTSTSTYTLRVASFRSGSTPFQYQFYIRIIV